jgi:hypothetical protein
MGKFILLLNEEGGEIFLCLGRKLHLGRPFNEQDVVVWSKSSFQLDRPPLLSVKHRQKNLL